MATSEKRIKYGYLYNWYATQGTGNASIITAGMESAGWVVSSYANFQTLNTYLSSDNTSGQKLKSNSLDYWVNTNGTNIVKFDGRGTGRRSDLGAYAGGDKTYQFVWCSDNNHATYARNINLYYASNSIGFDDTNYPKKYGMSIRLVRPATTPELSLVDGTYCTPYVGNDGQIYLTVKIGTQVWMAENLAETKYRNGDAIPNVTDNSAWAALTTGARCAYDNNEANVFL